MQVMVIFCLFVCLFFGGRGGGSVTAVLMVVVEIKFSLW